MSKSAVELVAELKLDSAELAKVQRDLETAKKEVETLTARAEQLSSSSSSSREEAIALAELLLGAGLGDTAVVAALEAQFGQKKRVLPRGDERKSHKLSDDIRAQISDFIAAHPEGVAAGDIMNATSADKVGMALLIKKLVTSGVVRAEGTTRSRKYFPVVQ